jgi:hypothetical protein
VKPAGTGGTIYNIALSAAFAAADADTPVRMAHILAATRTEYATLEHPSPAARPRMGELNGD